MTAFARELLPPMRGETLPTYMGLGVITRVWARLISGRYLVTVHLYQSYAESGYDHWYLDLETD